MKRTVTTLLALALLAAGNAAWAANEQVQTMRDATAVLNDFVNIPENAIPPALLSEAYGIAVIPDVFKAGFIVGGRYGEGVLSVRTADGTWSHPVFIDLAGASVGWQIGAASSDIILVFKSRRSVDEIVNGQVTLGVDASIAAGPVGRTASAATNLQLEAEIYSYSRSRGLFAGIALEGGVISIDEEANWRFYQEMVSARTLLQRSDRRRLPKSAQRFVYTLDQYMPPLSDVYGGTNRSGRPGYGQTRPSSGGQGRPYSGGYTQPYGNPQTQPRGTNRAPSYGTGRTQPYGAGQNQPYGAGGAQSGVGRQSQSYGNTGKDYSRPSGTKGNYGPVYSGRQSPDSSAGAGGGSGPYRDNTGGGTRY